jgi:hypothetical protein
MGSIAVSLPECLAPCIRGASATATADGCGRLNRRRLEAEAVRDNLLSVAGTLDMKRGGPAVRDFNAFLRPQFMISPAFNRTADSSRTDHGRPE